MMGNALWALAHVGTVLSQGLDLLLIAAGAALILLSAAARLGALAGMLGGVATLLAGPVGVIARYAGIALIVAGCCRLYVARELGAADATFQARQEAVVAKARADALAEGAASAAAEATDQATRVAATTKVKTVIIHDGATPACRDTPAFRAAADELRRRARAGAGESTAAGRVP